MKVGEVGIDGQAGYLGGFPVTNGPVKLLRFFPGSTSVHDQRCDVIRDGARHGVLIIYNARVEPEVRSCVDDKVGGMKIAMHKDRVRTRIFMSECCKGFV